MTCSSKHKSFKASNGSIKSLKLSEKAPQKDYKYYL